MNILYISNNTDGIDDDDVGPPQLQASGKIFNRNDGSTPSFSLEKPCQDLRSQNITLERKRSDQYSH